MQQDKRTNGRRVAAALQDPDRRSVARALGKVHTILFHIAPDIEVIVMTWMVVTFASVRFLLNTVAEGDIRLKPIPAGHLRLIDFAGHAFTQDFPLSAESLRALGYLGFDCGQSEFDQHILDRDLGDNTTSSLHLLIDFLAANMHKLTDDLRAELELVLKVMAPIFEAINKNDLSGQDIMIVPEELLAKKPAETVPVPAETQPENVLDALVSGLAAGISGKKRESRLDPASSTPHVARQLRYVIKGANILYADQPEKSVRLGMKCFDVIYANLVLMDEVTEEDKVQAQEMFKASWLTNSAESAFQVMYQDWRQEWDDTRLKEETETFVEQVEQALLAKESHWRMGYDDLFRGMQGRKPTTRSRVITMQPQRPSKKGRKQKEKRVRVTMMCSESTSGGAVMRCGNEEPYRYLHVRPEGTACKECGNEAACACVYVPEPDADGNLPSKQRVVLGERPYPDQPRLRGAVVAIQFYHDGLFIMSTSRKKKLERVAKGLRYLDLLLNDVVITDDIRGRLGLPGNFVSTARDGRIVPWLFLPAYCEAFGNFFGANPFQDACILPRWVIWSLTCAILETGYEVDPIEVVDWWLAEHPQVLEGRRTGDGRGNGRGRRDREETRGARDEGQRNGRNRQRGGARGSRGGRNKSQSAQ